VSRSGMNNHPRRLIDDDNIGILENYFYRIQFLERHLNVLTIAPRRGTGNDRTCASDGRMSHFDTRSAAAMTYKANNTV
jgi:hypothetical protein